VLVFLNRGEGAGVIRTKEVQIVVNGQLRQVPEGQSLLQLLALLEVDPARVAIELNGSIVRRELWTQTAIASGAALEIVQFVGGG
jgi:thiamine biosynthesis protein ThiS